MRIKQIKLLNYRQFQNVCIDFPYEETKSDIHVIVARNGVGKTNLLNAINWCLYDDEPHMAGTATDGSNMLPMVNLTAAEEIKATGGQTCEVKVEISTVEDGRDFIISRTARFNVMTNIQPSKSDLSFGIRGLSGLKLASGREAEELVSQFWPRKIRQYFFFDGELLLNYFTNGNRDPAHVKDSVYEISQVNMLSEVEKHLEVVKNGYEKEISNMAPDLERVLQKVNEAKDNLTDLDSQIEQLKEQIEHAEAEIESLNQKINGTESVVESNTKHQENVKRIEAVQLEREKKLKDLARFVRKYTILLLLYKRNRQTVEHIRASDASDAIALNTSADAIRKSLERKQCEICGSRLDEKGIIHLRELLDRLSTTPCTQRLAEIRYDVQRGLDVDDFEQQRDRLFDEANAIDERISELEDENKELEKKIRTVSQIDLIEALMEQRSNNYKQLKNNTEKLGRYKERREVLKRELSDLESEYNDALTKNSSCERLKAKRDFSTRAIFHVRKVKDEIVEKVKTGLQNETMKKFSELLWKKNVYDKVSLDESFSLKLFSKGRSCLMTASAAEKELLALSFAIALHGVSGHRNLLFIDTPVGRVDQDNRENFSKVLLTVGRQRQVILAFNPAEYSQEIRGVLNDEAIATVCSLEMKNGTVEVTKGA